AEVGALPVDHAVGRNGRGVDARERVRAGPVDRHVAPVPAGRVGVGRRSAAELRRGEVDVDVLHLGAGAVARVVHGDPLSRLTGALTGERHRIGAPGNAGLRVGAGEADRNRAVVPAEAV